MLNVRLISASYLTPLTFDRRFLGLGYIHAHALANKALADRVRISHDFYNIREKSDLRIAEEIMTPHPDIIAFGCYVWNTPQVLEIVKQVKRIRPEAIILLGGPEVDLNHWAVLQENPAVDYICVGEGEETFSEFLQALVNKSDMENVRGLAIQKENGALYTGDRPFAENPDRFESPFLTGVLELDEVSRCAFFQTTRGCPYDCAYCAYGRGRPYTQFSFERLKAEVEFFKSRKAKGLFCVDSVFNLNKKRALKALELFKEGETETGLWFEAHPKLFNKEFVEAVNQCHMIFMGVGLQTTNPEAMKNINRTWDPDKIGALMDSLNLGKNCLTSLEIIMGLPGDNLETFKNTLSWVYERAPSNVFVMPLQVLPQTGLHNHREKYKIKEAKSDAFHEIQSNYSFPADQIMVGKALCQWSRQIQSIFFRLHKTTGCPAGDLIERWAWKAYHEGLYDQLSLLQKNQVSDDLLERLASIFKAYCSELFKELLKPDLSLAFKELLRYHYLLRSVTQENSHIFYTLGVHTISTDQGHNPLWVSEGVQPPKSARKAVFEFDMKRLWTMTSEEEFLTLKPKQNAYLFFKDEKSLPCVVKA